MISVEQLLQAYELHKNITISLIDTIPAERFTEQPEGIKNHPAWILGHMVVAENNAYKLITGKSICSDEENELFTVGSEPVGDAGLYPDKTALVEKYLEMHRLLSEALEDCLSEVFAREMPVERLKPRFPTLGTFFVHVCSGHEGYHLGQMNVWRKVTGLAPNG
ncbi:DinB family protein [Planctomycetota bacterium]|nr:DinB family protein [Planctomycetota bacterium]